jgi:beta-glucosidase
MLGYAYGAHAPGRRDFGASIHAVHHLLLGHGLATQRMREAGNGGHEFGITLNMGVATPETGSEADVAAARHADGLGCRIYLDPLVRGVYPEDVVSDLAMQGIELPVQEGDLEVINTPIDVLGVNYYFSQTFSGVDEDGNTTGSDGRPVQRVIPTGRPITAMGWEIVPEGFTELLVRLHNDYRLPMVITENGSAFDDEPDETGFVQDDERIAYFDSHIGAVARARQQGADIRGYFAWSLMDNFEWAYGYDKRFGIIRVDYDTQQRIPKASAQWYTDTIRSLRQ